MKSIAVCALALLASAAPAVVVSSRDAGFVVRHEAQLAVPPAAAFAAFGRVGDWWDQAHTYSGDSRNLTLSMTAGGCFCEKLPGGGGVEHLRIAFIDPGKHVVLTGSLGPLLYEAVSGVMDATFEAAGTGTKVTLTYKAAGFANGGGDKLAPLVDQVIGQQFARFRSKTSPGS